MNLDHLGRRNQQSPPQPQEERLSKPFLGGGACSGVGRMASDDDVLPSRQQQQKQHNLLGTSAGQPQRPDDMNELSKLLLLYDNEFDRVQRHLEGALQHTEKEQDRLQHLKEGFQDADPSRKQHYCESQASRKQRNTAMGDQPAQSSAQAPSGANGALSAAAAAADASLMTSLGAFVGATDGSDGGPAMYAQHMMSKQLRQQRQPAGTSLSTSSSPGILSYSGTITTALGPSVAAVATPESLMDTSISMGAAAAAIATNRRSSSTAAAAPPPSMAMSLLGTQAQAQASYGVDTSFLGANNNMNFRGGGGGVMAQNTNSMMNGPAAAAASSSTMSFNGATNLQTAFGTGGGADSAVINSDNNMMMPPPPMDFSRSATGASCNNNRNTSGMMAGGGGGDGGLNNLGRLTPPMHPSVQGQDNTSLLGLASSSATTLQQSNTFQQQPSNFMIGGPPSVLMGGSRFTTPSPFDMGSVTSVPSMSQHVLRSQSVGSVQSTTSTGSAGSNGVGNSGNSRTSRMTGGGGFLGPGRALGPGGMGIKRHRARSDGSTGSANSSTSLNSAAAKSNIQALLRLHASAGGKQPNAEGMYPIHIACRDYPTSARLIGTMLCTSPGVGRLIVGRGSMGGQGIVDPRASLSSLNSVESTSSTAIALEGSYPIHIALANAATLDVVKLLVRQNPELLIKGDGTNRVPLSIALGRGAAPNVLDLLLSMNPNVAALPDLRNNYPLHLACARRTGSREQINLPLLRRLVEAYPASVHKRNFNGKTPLDLAQDGGLTDDDAISYLHEMAYMESDDAVIEAPDA